MAEDLHAIRESLRNLHAKIGVQERLMNLLQSRIINMEKTKEWHKNVGLDDFDTTMYEIFERIEEMERCFKKVMATKVVDLAHDMQVQEMLYGSSVLSVPKEPENFMLKGKEVKPIIISKAMSETDALMHYSNELRYCYAKEDVAKARDEIIRRLKMMGAPIGYESESKRIVNEVLS